MFVGYEVKSNQNQAKPIVLESDIKLSQAVLDPSSVKNKNKEPVCLVAEYNKKQFILAVLDPNQSWQCSLDLLFVAGSQVKFFVRGSGTVHLTGYEHHDYDDDLDMSMSDEFNETEDSETEVAPASKKSAEKEKVGSAKKLALTNGNKSSAKKTNGKSPKVAGGDQADNSDGSDDSEDEDFPNFEDTDDSDEEMDDDDDDELGDLDDDSDLLGESSEGDEDDDDDDDDE